MSTTPPFTASDAHTLHAALVAARTAERLPAGATIHIHVVDETKVAVLIGGLTDEFVFGPAATVRGIGDDPEDYTTQARRLHHEVIDLAREHLPRKESGELWHPFRVLLPTEAHWQSTPYTLEGVYLHGRASR